LVITGAKSRSLRGWGGGGRNMAEERLKKVWKEEKSGIIEGWKEEKDGKKRRMERREGWKEEKDGKNRRMERREGQKKKRSLESR